MKVSQCFLIIIIVEIGAITPPPLDIFLAHMGIRLKNIGVGFVMHDSYHLTKVIDRPLHSPPQIPKLACSDYSILARHKSRPKRNAQSGKCSSRVLSIPSFISHIFIMGLFAQTCVTARSKHVVCSR